nr:immunoglobulin heavy chain junction region [Mus musculus]
YIFLCKIGITSILLCY